MPQQKTMSDIDFFVDRIIVHEGLESNQTPFRITDPKMRTWTSMYDDTIKMPLDPSARKSKGRENFLYAKNPQDVPIGVKEQFRRYAERNPEITIADAVRRFDQTGAKGKLMYLRSEGFDPQRRLQSLWDSSIE